MSNEVREVAERIANYSLDVGSILVAKAYLAEHPADDSELITEGWLRSVGCVQGKFPDDLCVGPVIRGVIRNAQSPMNGHWYWAVRSYPIPEGHEPKTRGDMRRLCSALGIQLKEAS